MEERKSFRCPLYPKRYRCEEGICPNYEATEFIIDLEADLSNTSPGAIIDDILEGMTDEELEQLRLINNATFKMLGIQGECAHHKETAIIVGRDS